MVQDIVAEVCTEAFRIFYKIHCILAMYMGNSRPNQHEKWRYFSDFGETWGTHTLP